MKIVISIYVFIIVATFLVLVVRTVQMILISKGEMSKIVSNWDFYPIVGTLLYFACSSLLIIVKYYADGFFKIEWIQYFVRAFGMGVIVIVLGGGVYESKLLMKLNKITKLNFYKYLIVIALLFSTYSFFEYLFLA
ncbi:MAG TPA: hypothetical protein PLZ15_02565 [Melioribacteraceae bacterium]|nr:hypothetical protein [Melioribacteraceae bacterium]